VSTTTQPPSSTTVPTPTTTLPAPPPTIPPPAPPTTGTPPPEGKDILVTGSDGVYLVNPSNQSTRILEGNVAFAVDDTRGGLLFQLDRGRIWEDVPGWSTAVWWVPAKSNRPRRLVVPAPGSDHQLSLHDAYPTASGFAVVYTRHEGSIPNEDDVVERLRSYDVEPHAIEDLYTTGGFESGLGLVSVNTELVALTSFGQVGGRCTFVDKVGRAHVMPGDPSRPECDHGCPMACVISDVGDLMAYHEVADSSDPTLEIGTIDTPTGEERHRLRAVTLADAWSGRGLDLTENHLLLNVQSGSYRAGLLFDLASPAAPPRELPIAGRATFVEAPLQIGAPVQVSTSSLWRSGGARLFRAGRPIRQMSSTAHGRPGAAASLRSVVTSGTPSTFASAT